MRTFKLLVTFLMVALLAVSCKKDKENEPSAKDRITAKWTFEKVDVHEFYDGESDRETELGETGDYMDFRADGKLMMRLFEDEDEGTWKMVGDNKIWLSETDLTDEGTYDIKSLTNNSLVIYIKEVDGANYDEYTVYLKK